MATASQQTNFDWKSMYFLSPDAVKEYAATLRKTPTTENKELADMLEATPPETFELSAAQKKFTSYLNLLRKRSVPEDVINEFMKGITALVYHTTLQKIVSSMDEEVRAHWEEVMSNDPSIFQVILLLDFYTKNAFNKSLDEFMDDIIGNIVDEYQQEIETKLQYEELLEKLSETEVTQLSGLLADGDMSGALEFLVSPQSQNNIPQPDVITLANDTP
ncbi:MAG: hypothetical protein QY314_03510 [Candidatus Dojkabacteria bacterium]|nr:MAG: hypothetical protein QY314_03510 [Candidatus Dojkabacteria bacterium]